MSGLGLYPEVVVSTRLRLSRNCSEFAFSHRLGKPDAITLLARAERVFRKALPESGGPFTAETSSALERRFVSADEQGGCLVNHIDHFRIWREAGGLALAECAQAAHRVETLLGQEFPFAVNLEWGYLSPNLNNLGTALRVSAMLHLPALRQGMADRTLTAALEGAQDSQGMELLPWGPPGSALYCLRNRETLGLSEQAVMNKLDALTRVLLHYEKELAGRRRENGPLAFDDAVGRALGIARHCRLLSLGEAWGLLCQIRLGWLGGTFPGAKAESGFARQNLAARSLIRLDEQASDAQRADCLRAFFVD